jgi:hypothetical protein
VDDALAGLGLGPQLIRDHLRHESTVVIRPFTQKMLQAPRGLTFLKDVGLLLMSLHTITSIGKTRMVMDHSLRR